MTNTSQKLNTLGSGRYIYLTYLWLQQFQGSDKALAATLMSKLSSMKFDGYRGIPEMRDLAAELNDLELWLHDFMLA